MVGFSHTGGGWKNREFYGHIYGFDGSLFSSMELSNEFWVTPTQMLADATNNTVWVLLTNVSRDFQPMIPLVTFSMF